MVNLLYLYCTPENLEVIPSIIRPNYDLTPKRVCFESTLGFNIISLYDSALITVKD